eukprot:4341984-Amphidinium_carterae.1
MLRATSSPQADLGRWMHVILQVRPEVCMHVLNLYGWVDVQDGCGTRCRVGWQPFACRRGLP